MRFGLSVATSAFSLFICESYAHTTHIYRELPDDATLSINGFTRPTFQGGKLELYVERVAGGLFAPVERQSPQECCGGHDDEAPISL